MKTISKYDFYQFLAGLFMFLGMNGNMLFMFVSFAKWDTNAYLYIFLALMSFIIWISALILGEKSSKKYEYRNQYIFKDYFY